MRQCIAFIKDPVNSRIKLITYRITGFGDFFNVMTANEIENGIAEEILDDKYGSVFDHEQLRKRGIFKIIDLTQVLWMDKLDDCNHQKEEVTHPPFTISSVNGLRFPKAILDEAASKIPNNALTMSNGPLRIIINQYNEEFGVMDIPVEGGTFTTEKVDAVYVSYTFDRLEVYCGDYTYCFWLDNAQSMDKSEQNTFSSGNSLTEEYRKETEKLRNELLKNIKTNMKKLEKLLEEVKKEWVYEDMIYRMYHGSFKVYAIQKHTLRIHTALKKLLPQRELNAYFIKIIQEGTGKKFILEANQYFLMDVLPMTTAFFHAVYMLEMIIKYGKELNEANISFLPSGWAAVLYLYNLR